MKAIDMCREKSFNGTRYECTLIDDCQTLLDRIRLVNKEAKKAKKQMIGEQVEVVVDAAKRIKLKSETIIYLSEILNGSQKIFLQKQINGAVAEKDMTRASRVQVELHNLNVQQNKGNPKKPDTFIHLQTPMQWSQGSAKKAVLMHEWQSRSISEPLTNKCVNILDNKAKKEMKARIVHNFHTIQKAMGQRNTSRIPLRFQELCLNGITHHAVVADEIYLSIIKQCNNNPATMPDAKPSCGSDGIKMAVRLLCYCLTCFPPSKEFAPHLAWWIRQDTIQALGAPFNLNGLLARSLIFGHVKASEVPLASAFEAAGKISYHKHWIGSSWNGDGLSEGRSLLVVLSFFSRLTETSKLIFFFSILLFFFYSFFFFLPFFNIF